MADTTEPMIGEFPRSVILQMLIDQKIGRLKEKSNLHPQHGMAKAEGVFRNPAALPFTRRESLKQELNNRFAPQPQQKNFFDTMKQTIVDIIRRKREREAMEAQAKVDRFKQQEIKAFKSNKTGDIHLRRLDPKQKKIAL